MSEEEKGTGLTEEQLEFIREDLKSGMGYTKIKMINDFVKKLKSEGKSTSEIWEAIKQFRKEKGWSDGLEEKKQEIVCNVFQQQCKEYMDKLEELNKEKFYLIQKGISSTYLDNLIDELENKIIVVKEMMDKQNCKMKKL